MTFAFIPPGDKLVGSPWRVDKVLLWDVRTGILLDTLHTEAPASYRLSRLAAFPDGNRVICCLATEAIVWDIGAKTARTLPTEESGRFGSVAFTADGSRFATNVYDGHIGSRILIWDAKTCRVTSVVPTGSTPGHFAFALDGGTVAADYYDPSLPHSYDPNVGYTVVGVWDSANGKKLFAGRLFNTKVFDLAYTRDGKYLLAAGVHKDVIEEGGAPEIGVWDLTTGKLVNKLPMRDAPVGHMAISPDNKLLAVPGPEIDIYTIEYAAQPKRD